VHSQLSQVNEKNIVSWRTAPENGARHWQPQILVIDWKEFVVLVLHPVRRRITKLNIGLFLPWRALVDSRIHIPNDSSAIFTHFCLFSRVEAKPQALFRNSYQVSLAVYPSLSLDDGCFCVLT